MHGSKEFKLNVGETAKLKQNIMSHLKVVFAGMLNDSTFSIAILWTHGNNSLAYNLYLPVDQKEVEIPKGNLEIMHVSNKGIRFKYYGK